MLKVLGKLTRLVNSLKPKIIAITDFSGDAEL